MRGDKRGIIRSGRSGSFGEYGRGYMFGGHAGGEMVAGEYRGAGVDEREYKRGNL